LGRLQGVDREIAIYLSNRVTVSQLETFQPAALVTMSLRAFFSIADKHVYISDTLPANMLTGPTALRWEEQCYTAACEMVD
jgi:hypothetical protein